jgi:hypothetical protein
MYPAESALNEFRAQWLWDMSQHHPDVAHFRNAYLDLPLMLKSNVREWRRRSAAESLGISA